MRPSQGFWGSGEQGHLFQGNKGTKSKYRLSFGEVDVAPAKNCEVNKVEK